MTGHGDEDQVRPIEIRMVVSDVDGTLVRNDKSLTGATIAAVQRLRDAGIAFSIISARPSRGLSHPIETLGIDQPTAAFNGGTVTGPEGQVLLANRLTDDVAARTVELLQHENVETWVFADDEWLVVDENGPQVPRERRTIGFGPTVLASFASRLARVDKIVAASNDYPLLERLEKTVGDALHGQARAIRSQPYYLDVTDLKADKGNGVAALADAAGVPLEHVAVLGDGHNDIAMFQRAGLAIAMGQSAPEVRAAATHVTKSNEEDGVADAIERLILVRI